MDPEEVLEKKEGCAVWVAYLHEWDLLGAVGTDEPEPRVRLDAEPVALAKGIELGFFYTVERVY